MSERLPIIVVDTSVFLDVMQNNPERVDDALEVLRGHGSKHLVAMPSIQELEFCALRKFETGNQDAKTRLAAKKAHYATASDWLLDQRYLSIELNQSIVRRAAEIWGNCHVRRNDAAMVAAAEYVRATNLYTFDKKLIRQIEGFGARVRVEVPPPSGALPLFGSTVSAKP